MSAKLIKIIIYSAAEVVKGLSSTWLLSCDAQHYKCNENDWHVEKLYQKEPNRDSESKLKTNGRLKFQLALNTKSCYFDLILPIEYC